MKKKIKNSQPKTKFIGSYKKKSVLKTDTILFTSNVGIFAIFLLHFEIRIGY